MNKTSQSTLSVPDDGDESYARSDCWFRVLTAEQARGGSSRHRLTGLDEIAIRRGRATTSSRVDRTLTQAIADPMLSNPHARVTRDRSDGNWYLEDLGSKNGCWRNGERVQRAPLLDGDVLELGRTFFVFRAAQPWLDAWDDDQVAHEEPSAIRTLCTRLAIDLVELAKVATSRLPILIGGETGTGKERAVRMVHALSGRTGQLVAINCASLSRTLVESELFGFRKGSFSGATKDHVGLVAASDRGTLFLDEIGELSLEAQAALLRVLQEREVLAIGATKPQSIDLRVVGATHRDLYAHVRAGTFRDDLLQRLSGFPLRLPPLRERREDIGILIDEILADAGASQRELSMRAARTLMTSPYRGNVREIELALRAACVLSATGPLSLPTPTPATASVARSPVAAPPTSALSAADIARRDQLIALLRTHRGNLAEVARELGKAREQIYRWLTRYGVDAESFR